MKLHMKRLILLICIVTNFTNLFAQTDSARFALLQEKLYLAKNADLSFAEKIDLSVSNISVAELLKNVAKASNTNLNVNIDNQITITCNFKQISISDLIFFVCKEYNLDIELVENIVIIQPYQALAPEPVLELFYDSLRQTVSFNFSNAKLIDVSKKITEYTDVNIIVSQDLFEQPISAFGNKMPISEAIHIIAAVNHLLSQRKNDKTWYVFRIEDTENDSGANQFDFNEINIDSLRRITAHVPNGNVRELILEVSRKLNLNHFLTDNLDHKTAIFVDSVDLETFFKVLFSGTNFSWRVENGVYIFGNNEGDNKLSIVRVIPMKYRTVDKVKEIIPESMKQNMEVITFHDLNSLVLFGKLQSVSKIIEFLEEIDKSVPLILMDIIIVDATDTDVLESGISAGLKTEPTTTSGSLSPGVDISLGAASINQLINTFNGFGSINLGKVSQNFYVNLKFLEEKGKIIIKSTPRLSTLNGNKASLKSGETKFYRESQTNIIGTQNPLQSESYIWKEIQANFTLDILPYLSQDSSITLDINIIQTEFTERENKDEDGPPGTITRSFKSIIKVKDQEMVLLGGIEKNMQTSTSKGLPFIARIPILKWIFGSSSKNVSSQKLNVFVKPTII